MDATRYTDPLRLPPWIGSRYFETPKAGSLTSVIGQTTTILSADAMRALILFSLSTTTANALLVPNALLGTAHGWTLTAQNPAVLFSWWNVGPLVNQLWSLNPSSGGTAQVDWVTLNFRDWPGGDLPDYDPTVPVRRPPPPRQTLPTGPGLYGGRGPLDYWHALLNRLRLR